MTATGENEATIFINHLRMDARVGVNPGEEGAEQPIALDIRVGVEDMSLAARSGRLQDTTDYVAIARVARKVVEQRHYPLVETLATEVARAVLARPGVTWAQVRLRKLHCLKRASGAGVEVRLGLQDATDHPTPVGLGEVARPEDVVVVGGGAAGFSAALWCWRLGHPALLVDRSSSLGGQLHLVHGAMTDLPAQNPMTGPALARRLWRQFVHIQGRWLRAAVQDVHPTEEGVRLHLAAPHGGSGKRGADAPSSLQARTVIVTSGVRRRQLGVPGEKEFYGKGILPTAAKDIDHLAGQRVVVVGGGDSACENALILVRQGAQVALIHRGTELSARNQFAQPVHNSPEIEVHLQSTVQRFGGQQALESVTVAGPQGQEDFPVAAALVRIGWVPNSEFLPSSWVHPDGFLRSDPATGQVSGQERVFGAGDLLGRISPCVATSFGSGALAARAAIKRLDDGSKKGPDA